MAGDCTKFSAATAVPLQTIAALPVLTLTGEATSGGSDEAIVSVDETLYQASGEDNVVNLASGWTTSEFNVFGNGGGTQAVFNSGATLIVGTTAQNSTTHPPATVDQSLTGETNNLTLVPASGSNCAVGGSTPAIYFTESNVSGAQAVCPPVVSAVTSAINYLLLQ